MNCPILDDLNWRYTKIVTILIKTSQQKILPSFQKHYAYRHHQSTRSHGALLF